MAGSFNLNFRLKYCNPIIELAKFRNIEIPQSCDGKFQIRENMTRRFLNFFFNRMYDCFVVRNSLAPRCFKNSKENLSETNRNSHFLHEGRPIN